MMHSLTGPDNEVIRPNLDRIRHALGLPIEAFLLAQSVERALNEAMLEILAPENGGKVM